MRTFLKYILYIIINYMYTTKEMNINIEPRTITQSMSRQNVLPEQRTPRILKRNSSSFNFCVTPQKILDKLELDILRGTSELEILKKRLQKVDKYCIQIEDQLHQKL